jgi:hypothetical protein
VTLRRKLGYLIEALAPDMPAAVVMARVIVVVSVAEAMVQDMAPVVELATAQTGKQYFGCGVHNSWRDPTSKGV